MSITLTPKAAEHIQAMLTPHSGVARIRLALKSAGCSGFKYSVDIAKEMTEADQLFESQGIEIVVEKKNLVFVDGTEIDYVQEGLNAKLLFHNPHVEDSCGCGESVTFKEKG